MRQVLGALALTAFFVLASQAHAQRPISVDHYVSDPALRQARLSPDGRHVLAIRTTAQGDTLLRFDWRTGQAVALQQVQRGEARNTIDWAEWKSNDRLVLSVSTTRPYTLREVRGAHIRSAEEVSVIVSRLIAIDASDGGNLRAMFEGQTRNLAFSGASTRLSHRLPFDPDHVLLAAYGQHGYGIYRGNVNTGRTERVAEGGWDGSGWGIDGPGNVVIRYEDMRGGAGYRIFRRAPGEQDWIHFADFRGGEQVSNPDFDVVAPGPGPGLVWVYARPEGRDTSGLYLFNTATGQYGDVQYEHSRADFRGDVWTTRNYEQMLAACVRFQRRECRYFDQSVGRHIRAVDAFFEGRADVTLVDMSEDGNVWLVYVQGPSVPPTYYIYDKTSTAVLPVSATRPFTEAQLSPMEVVSYAGRDGAELWGYLTAPRTAPAAGAPMVVFVHGGPESRDYYQFEREVQFYASRGYLVFQPQFRGSGGFGTAFAHAGRRQWGQMMQHDVTDGVHHLIQSGRVDPNRICIVGHSYGGYAAMAGATLTPELYRCVIAINGVYDLREFLRTAVINLDQRSSSLDYWRNSIGTDRAELEAVSPRMQAAAVRAPVLLVAAEQDWVVPVRQGQLMRDALQRAGKDVRYVEVPREGHSWYWWRHEARVRLFQETEAFLARHLASPAQ
jgi:dipeptidyl aminopeptidase/acylaminoacyl peptidase